MIALIFGGAESVWEDGLAATELILEARGPDAKFMTLAVNDVGCFLPDLDVWVTLHPEKLPDWARERRRNGLPMDGIRTVSNRPALIDRGEGREPEKRTLTDDLILHWGGGSVGLYAVAVAYASAASHVILCGVPLAEALPFPQSQEEHTVNEELDGFRRAWDRKAERIRERTRSMGGWTRELLGAPTREWLNDG